MTPNPYTVLGVQADEMDKLQLNVSLADKRFIDSIVPDRGFKTWAVASFFIALVKDIKAHNIDTYSLTNEQTIRQLVRDRTAEHLTQHISGGNDSRRSKGVRKTHAKRAKKSTSSSTTARQRVAT